MSIKRIMLAILAVALGTLMFVYADIDDSPGGQLIGVVVAIGGVFIALRRKKSH